MSNIAQKIFLNTAWQLVFRTIEIGLGIITLGLITRYLGQVQFGYYTTIIAWLTFFITLVDLGLYLTLLREISAQTEEKMSKIVSNVFTLRIITSLIFLSLSYLIVNFLDYPTSIKTGVLAASASYFFISLVTVLTAIFQKQLAMPKVALANALNKVLFLGFVIFIISSKGSLEMILWSSSLASFFYFLLTWIFTAKYINLKLSFDFSYWKTILIKTWPIALTTALNLIYFKLDTLFLSWFQSPAEVGLYGATYRVLEIVATFPHMFMGLILPLFTAAWVAGDIQKLRVVWQKSFDFFSFITLPMIFGTIMVATPLMTLVAGTNFSAAGPILQVLILATAAIFFGTLFTYMVLALDKQKAMIKFFGLAALLSIIGYYMFIPTYSYWGAAWVTVVIELLIILFAWVVIKGQFNYKPSFKAFNRLLLASLGMSVVIHYISFLPVLIVIAIAILVYLILVVALRAFDLKEAKMLISKK